MLMKPVLTLCILITFLINRGNAQQHNLSSSLSIFTDIGLINSDAINWPVGFLTCYECYTTIVEQLPKPSLRYSIGAEVRIGKRHFLSGGFLNNSIKFDSRSLYLLGNSGNGDLNEMKLKYRGAQLLYRLVLAQNGAMQFSFAVGAQYDKFKGSNRRYWIIPLWKHNYSGILKTEFAFEVGEWNQFTISPLFKMAIKRYDARKIDDKFLPFGYGLMMGWRTKLV